jgi:putative Holliday junction resolvase
VQDTETLNTPDFSDLSRLAAEGRILALDIGTKRIGAATCDELRVTVRALPVIPRKSWKDLLLQVKKLVSELDAVGLVLGLPLNMPDVVAAESALSTDIRRMARNFSLSLEIPVFLHDERLTSVAAEENLRDRGIGDKERKELIDSEAAAVILEDFLSAAPGAKP